MQRRSLGSQRLEVTAPGEGSVGMSRTHAGHGDPTEATVTLLEAVDSAITLIDTAEVYGPHTNERLLGRHRQRPRPYTGPAGPDLAPP
jgi:aryl-alcohol dehydrogenase-like predicted oxidoreductase